MEPLELNRSLGQVLTPFPLAIEMAKLVKEHATVPPAVVIDPAVGPGTFIEALAEVGLRPRRLVAFDVDERMVEASRQAAIRAGAGGTSVYCEDYLVSRREAPGSVDLVIMNPPYLRQELLSATKKATYRKNLGDLASYVEGRSNYYCYFIARAVQDLRSGGLLCAIVYDGLTQTRYGKRILAMLDTHTDVLYSGRVSSPFDNVIIDATIILARKRALPRPLAAPPAKSGATTLGQLGTSQRGTGLICARLFMARPEQPYYGRSAVFVKKNVRGSLVIAAHHERAYLFDQPLRADDPVVKWLEDSADRLHSSGVNGLKRLMALRMKCDDRWYRHRTFAPPIVMNYYVRSEPRHLLNAGQFPVADNFYGFTPEGLSVEAAWLLLNSAPYRKALWSAARDQGSGLRKLQLYEYKSTEVPDWRLLSAGQKDALTLAGRRLAKSDPSLDEIDRLVAELLTGTPLNDAAKTTEVRR